MERSAGMDKGTCDGHVVFEEYAVFVGGKVAFVVELKSVLDLGRELGEEEWEEN